MGFSFLIADNSLILVICCMFLLGGASPGHMKVYDRRPGPIPRFFTYWK